MYSSMVSSEDTSIVITICSQKWKLVMSQNNILCTGIEKYYFLKNYFNKNNFTNFN